MSELKENTYHKKVIEALAFFSGQAEELPQGCLPSQLVEKIKSNNGGFDLDFNALMRLKGFEGQYDNFSDEQKERFALAHRSFFDDFIYLYNGILCYMTSLENKDKDFKEFMNEFNLIFGSASLRSLKFNFAEFETDEDKPLQLTCEEYYYAFSFLSKEQIRKILSQQKPKIFDRLFCAYASGKEKFLHALEETDVAPMRNLRYYLQIEIEKISPFTKYLDTNKDARNSNLPIIINESLESWGETKSARYFNLLNLTEDTPVEDVIALFSTEEGPDYMDKVLHKVANFLCSCDEVLLNEKQDVKRLYDEWVRKYPNSPRFEETPISNDSERMVCIATELLDDWILSSIHDRMGLDGEKNIIQESVKESNETNSGDVRRLPEPIRFTENHIGSQYYEAILKHVYSLYGHKFIDMTEDEFVYFFGATNKKPHSYNPPYYWNGEASEMKAILRILYTSSTGKTNPSRSFGRLILMPEDKNQPIPYHNWGKGKHHLGVSRLTVIENRLKEIVKSVTGKDLLPIDLHRKYDYGEDKGNKTKRKSNKKVNKIDEEAESRTRENR